jgi:tyrosyl-tRNA synthetase
MTYQPKAEFLRVMIARGYMQDCTDLEGLDKALMAGVVPAYIGYDCTAPSLHVGNLVSIMMLHWLQQTGTHPGNFPVSSAIILYHMIPGKVLSFSF